jgi:hypothetical protein
MIVQPGANGELALQFGDQTPDGVAASFAGDSG